jgi:hypothetical protein
MHIREKINLKKYFALSFALFVTFLIFFHHPLEIKVLVITFIATLVNQYMLIRAVHELIVPVLNGQRPDSGWIGFLFIFKSIILIAALIYGVQIIGNKIIISVLFYVCQIFVLAFSSKRVSKEFN